MDTLKDELLSRRASIMRELQLNMRTTRERGAIAGLEVAKDPYGSASSAHDDELAAITMDRLAHELKLIDQALVDVETGRYGVCIECEEPIAPKRLKALPFATRCLACQEESERTARAA
jgi:DnaK suppressor protein